MSIDYQEVAKFAQHADVWWDVDGPLKTLHDLNPARLACVEQHVKLKNQRVLDVGCGGGIFAEAMAGAGANVIGIDVEPHAIAAAVAHAQQSNLQIQYFCQSVESLSIDPVSIVTCMELLEHVPDPAQMVAYLARHLQPGGYMFISTINRTLQAYAEVIVAAEYVLNLLPRQTHDYAKFIKPSELAAMVRRAGLNVICIYGVSYNPFTRSACLSTSVRTNYLLACRQEIS